MNDHSECKELNSKSASEIKAPSFYVECIVNSMPFLEKWQRHGLSSLNVKDDTIRSFHIRIEC